MKPQVTFRFPVVWYTISHAYLKMSKKGNTKQAFPAGEITTQLSDAISDFGLSHNNETIFPIDFGSNGSCFAVFNLSLH